jgi:hypothetical protein
MGYMIAMSQCFGCGRVIAYNPDLVPSIKVSPNPDQTDPYPWISDPQNGIPYPVCRECVERVNPIRVAGGLEPIVPHPDAYKEMEV